MTDSSPADIAVVSTDGEGGAERNGVDRVVFPRDGDGETGETDPDTHSILEQTLEREVEAPDVIKEATRDMQEALADYKEMRVLLVGKSGVGKSSFVNCLLQENLAQVGRVKPETSKVTDYTLICKPEGDHSQNPGVMVRVFDTPGFGANRKENEKFVLEIREKCKIVDVIFLCIRMDDQLRVEDRHTISLFVQNFDDKFWGKSLIVFTRANMVTRMGQYKKSRSEKDYLKTVRDELKEEIQKVFEKTKVTVPQFVLAGAPEFTQEGRLIPNIVNDNSQEDNIDWLPVLAVELFRSGCSDNAKAILLKCGWGKWAHAGAGFGAGAAMGVALGGGIMAVGGATLFVPPVGLIALALGGGVVGASLIFGGVGGLSGGAKALHTKIKHDRHVSSIKGELERKKK